MIFGIFKYTQKSYDTNFCFSNENPMCFTVNYLVDNFFENFDVLKSNY